MGEEMNIFYITDVKKIPCTELKIRPDGYYILKLKLTQIIKDYSFKVLCFY